MKSGSPLQIAVIRNVQELEIVRSFLGKEFETSKVYTYLPSQYMELVRCGVKPNIFSQHVREDEVTSIYRDSHQQISKAIDHVPTTEGPSNRELARFAKVHYWEYLTNANTLDLAIRRLWGKHGKTKIVYIQNGRLYPKIHSELSNADVVFAQIMNTLSMQHPDKVKGITGDRISFASRVTDSLRSYWLSARLIIGNGVSNKRAGSGFSDSLNGVKGKRIIAFGSSFDALITISDAITLGKETGLVPLWMTESFDKNTIRSGLSYHEEYDKIQRFSITRFLSENPDYPLSLSEIREAYSSYIGLMRSLNKIDVIRRYRLVGYLSLLRSQFFQMAKTFKTMKRVLSQFCGSTIILSDYNGLRERAVEAIAPELGIQVVSRPHGYINNIEGYEFRTFRYFVPDSLSEEVVKSFYGSDLKTVISPDPGIIGTSRRWQGKDPAEKAKIISKKKRRWGLDESFHVLFMTTAARKHILNEFVFSRLKIFWSRMLKYMKENEGLRFAIKSHKNNYDEWVRDQAAEYDVRNLRILEGRLEDALIISDMAVDFGKPGTATVVALAFHKPLLVFRGLYKYVRELSVLVHRASEPFSVDTVDQMILELDRFRTQKDKYLEQLLEKNRSLHKIMVGDNG